MTSALEDRYDDRIAGVLSCYGRAVITGTLPAVCCAEGMTRFLHARGNQIFKYPEFAMTPREGVRVQVAPVVAEAGVTIEHITESHIRKEAIVAKVLEQRGDHPGPVHVLSAMEACASNRPWHDKQSHQTFLRPDTGKCLHYYTPNPGKSACPLCGSLRRTFSAAHERSNSLPWGPGAFPADDAPPRPGSGA